MCAFTRTPLRDPFYVGGTGFKPRSHARGIDRVLSARAKLVHSEEPRCGSRTRQRKRCKIFKRRYRNCVTIVRESLRTKRLKKSAGIVGLHADRLIVPVINGQRRRDEAGEGGKRRRAGKRSRNQFHSICDTRADAHVRLSFPCACACIAFKARAPAHTHVPTPWGYPLPLPPPAHYIN